MLVPWFLLNFIGVDGLGMDRWYSFGICDHFRILFGLFTCLSWWNILFIERYLAAKIGTIFLTLVWWVFFITRDWSGFVSMLVFQWVLFSSDRWYSFIKFCYLSLVPGVAGEDTELLCYVMFKLVWNFNTFDWVLLVGWGLLLRCKRVVSIYCCCFCLSSLVVWFLGWWNICILSAI